MLTRLYIDNFRCLSNFDLRPSRIQLLTGLNGSGKSSVLEALGLVRDFVDGRAGTAELFPSDSLTRWDRRATQTFELNVNGDNGPYVYSLTIEHQPYTTQNRVIDETLTLGGKPLFGFCRGVVQLYRDDFSTGPTFKFDWQMSGLGALGSRQDNRRLDWFRQWLSSVQVVRLNPFAMVSLTEKEEGRPRPDMSNFASWYRHLSLELPQLVSRLQTTLAELWPEFVGLKLEKLTESSRALKAVFRDSAAASHSEQSYSFHELSDGERALAVLYCLLHYARLAASPLICIDEPLGFVALPEVQPWINAAVETAEDGGFQLLLTSHHPELINYLAPERSRRLKRVHGGPTQIVPFVTNEEAASTLSPAEIVARGWEDPDD